MQEHVGFLRGFEGIPEFHLPAGEVIVLDVDEKQGGIHMIFSLPE